MLHSSKGGILAASDILATADTSAGLAVHGLILCEHLGLGYQTSSLWHVGEFLHWAIRRQSQQTSLRPASVLFGSGEPKDKNAVEVAPEQRVIFRREVTTLGPI